MGDHLSLSFTGAKERAYGPTDWLAFILAVNGVCDVGGAQAIFGDPEIQPASLTTPYTELYPEARVELAGDGRGAARIIATTPHAASVFRVVAEAQNLPFVEPETVASILTEVEALRVRQAKVRELFDAADRGEYRIEEADSASFDVNADAAGLLDRLVDAVQREA